LRRKDLSFTAGWRRPPPLALVAVHLAGCHAADPSEKTPLPPEPTTVSAPSSRRLLCKSSTRVVLVL